MWILPPPLMKVITLWEPLKPFLVILVEVMVLVAAILLYERSQSKKNCATGKTTQMWVCFCECVLYWIVCCILTVTYLPSSQKMGQILIKQTHCEYYMIGVNLSKNILLPHFLKAVQAVMNGFMSNEQLLSCQTCCLSF